MKLEQCDRDVVGPTLGITIANGTANNFSFMPLTVIQSNHSKWKTGIDNSIQFAKCLPVLKH